MSASITTTADPSNHAGDNAVHVARNMTTLTIILLFVLASCALGGNERELQKPKVTTVYYSTDNPSMSPSRFDRPEHLVVCSGVSAEVETMETDVEFYTRIETDSSNATASDATTAITWVSSEVIDALANRVCDETNNNKARARRLNGSCIFSISSGSPDTRIVSCTPEAEASKSCTWYRGSLRLLHLHECESDDISTLVLGTLQNITTADFSKVTHLLSIKVTDVEFTDAPSLSKEITGKSVESSRVRLTSGGASITIILTLTLVGLVILLLAIRRVRRYRLDKVSFDDSAIGSKESKSRNHIEPNWRDLGARHSCMDCRQCNSLTCRECNNEKNQVRMLKFDRNTLNDLSTGVEITKVEESNDVPDQRQTPICTLIRDVESDGIRIDGKKDRWPTDDDDDTKPKNGPKSVLL